MRGGGILSGWMLVGVLAVAACSGGANDDAATGDGSATDRTQPTDADAAPATPDDTTGDTAGGNADDTGGSPAETTADTASSIDTTSTTLPPDPWDLTTEVVTGSEFAAVVARTGDIDNLGYGWPAGFDPFAGAATPIHEWTFVPEPDDPAGTDRIMVVSGFDFAGLDRDDTAFDGYTTETDRASSMPAPIVIEWDPVPVSSAAIQLFIDDFQSPFFLDDFVVTLDGREARDVATFLNGVDQSGPIGRLITIGVLPEFHDLLDDGRLQILIDGPHHAGGEGFAVDFAQVVIDPIRWQYAGTVSGTVVDDTTGAPIEGALVSATNVVQAVTDADGAFALDAVPAGRVVLTASLTGYDTTAVQLDLEADATGEAIVLMPPVTEDLDTIVAGLDDSGSVDLYGVLFESGEAILSDESTFVLAEVLGAIYADPQRRILIVGHTDHVGTPEYNLDLSARRAQAVVDWLIGAGLPEGVATAEGRGEAEPVADNATDEGRALNRRVELRVLD